MIRGITWTQIQVLRSPLFRKPVTGQELIYAVSYSKPALSAITSGARSFSQTCSVQLCTTRNASPCIACRENLMNRKKGLYDGGQFIAWYVFGPFCQQRFSQLHSIFPCHAMLQGKNNQMRRQLCLEMDCFKRFRVFP